MGYSPETTKLAAEIAEFVTEIHKPDQQTTFTTAVHNSCQEWINSLTTENYPIILGKLSALKVMAGSILGFQNGDGGVGFVGCNGESAKETISLEFSQIEEAYRGLLISIVEGEDLHFQLEFFTQCKNKPREIVLNIDLNQDIQDILLDFFCDQFNVRTDDYDARAEIRLSVAKYFGSLSEDDHLRIIADVVSYLEKEMNF